MAEDKPSLHIDTDWKRQAQEEKRRLADQEAAKAKAPAAAPATPSAMPNAAPLPVGAARPAERGQPSQQGTFNALVQSIFTQVLYYLGDISARGIEPQINLDMAKYNIDVLGILEDKTRGNLVEDEKKLIDTVLYDARSRFVAVASQYI